ncbi:MAG TPA: hypothetical protein VGD88_15385 [Opitutaceae bacterium]
MQLPDEAPKLPKLPFLLGDGALLATAWFIARSSEVPLAPGPLLAIVGCVALGAILAVIPFIAEYARKQEESVQERQNALEALSRTTTTAAEQISIAASGLHTIAELTQKNLKAAEQLGPKLQEKINDFARRADEALVAENEALTQEVNTLRASDAEKLETASDKIRTTAADLAKLEATTHQHLAAVSATLARLPALAEEATQKAAGIQSETARATLAQLLTEIDIRVAAAVTRLAAATPPAPPPAAPEAASNESTSSNPSPTPPAPVETTPEPKRKRSKPAPKEDAAESRAVAAADSAPTPTTEPAIVAPAEPVVASEPAPTPAPEPVPASEESVAAPVIAPVAPVEPVSEVPTAPEPIAAMAEPAAEPTPAPTVAEGDAPLPPPDDVEEASTPKPARKAKKAVSTSAPPFIPGLLNSDAPLTRPGGDFSSLESGDDAALDLGGPPIDRAISADGLTRLLATAYIGIGNKLYIRGDGPGLSWDKGVPLQFVSIGKWRWETADATASFSAKLYKNDQIECASLGSLTLDPGQQTEVNAAF